MLLKMITANGLLRFFYCLLLSTLSLNMWRKIKIRGLLSREKHRLKNEAVVTAHATMVLL